MNMSSAAQDRLKKSFAEASDKLKTANDFIEGLANITDCNQHSLHRWVIRARLLRGKAPAAKPDSDMFAWNASWRSWRLPTWFKKACRHWLVQQKLWVPYQDPMQLMMSGDNIYCILFDHVGTIGEGPMRRVVLQPYGNYDTTAQSFAEAIKTGVEIIRPGIWHPDTTTYIFRYDTV